MRPFLSAILFSLTLASPTPRDVSSTSNDMLDVIANSLPCASNAVIFGRGTFDTGNIGVWVGPAFKSGLLASFDGDVHIQGISEDDYPASLDDYVKEGGSESGADSCARTVDDYVEKCPEANVFLGGWSQGALVAHKCANRIGAAAREQLKGFAAFGDENALMDDPEPLPTGLPYKGYCVQDTLSPDVLCTDSLTSGIKIPTSLEQFKQAVIGPLSQLADIATNADQRAAALAFPGSLLSGLTGVMFDFLKDLAKGKLRRWMVLPPHFKYGNNGMAGEAAAWIASLT